MNLTIDLLNRSNFINNVINMINQLSKNRKGCCFAIEGCWGIGKTFVIEKIEEQLKLIQSEETSHNKYFVFHYNCWQHDYYEEPSVAIISAMIESVQRDTAVLSVTSDSVLKAAYDLLKEKLGEIAGSFLENKIGVNLITVAEDFKKNLGENKKSCFEFDKLFNFSQTIENMREKMQEIAAERTLVLIVDELDRCIPYYAIKVLERLHHIFYNLENVIVLMAIDRKQIEHSVEEMFGIKDDRESMDIEKYLKKFIDFSMVLDYGTLNTSFYEKYRIYFDKFIISENSEDREKINELMPALFSGTDIRSQEKIIEKANVVHSIICNTPLDISVLVFEVLYEVLELWNFESKKKLAFINDIQYPRLEQQLGKEKMDLLKDLEARAWNGKVTLYIDNKKSRKCLLLNLYGKVFWYYSAIFNKKDMPYFINDEDRLNFEECLNIAQKYCEYRKIIK